MATMAAEPSNGRAGDTEHLAMPSRNPIPLSASQEAQVREVFYDRVRRHCTAEIKAFAECALGRTFSVPFVCRDTHRAMNGCMKSNATPAEEDAAREEWFAKRMERARQRQEKEKRKVEQQKFLREWWGLSESEREAAIRREQEAKLKLPERIGGMAVRRPRGDDADGKR